MNAEQARMARALLQMGVREVAAEAGVTPNTISRIENGGDAKTSTIQAIKAVYEAHGIVFVERGATVQTATVFQKAG
ncbi:helix-turn-helix domain-containing protein [Roseibium salinum]|uniref:Helix-turn-helix transcriptional regulator n=1 Tax=Roseibium salinum TaxID=1604349 RepID=A0ABT3QYQ0_9HYPH|nr:helix-turn-helix transcriptional regulator [Roseibium sp. DSM 29163]MCX2721961.1 helix-turn-helix transcriptional regulator [Roseibium sp. DSM 29163]